MIIIFLRTVLIYVFLIVILRLMGKRQLGELEMSDLVISLLLSEIATIPITDRTSPLSHAVIPILTLASLEFITSALTLKLPRFKKLLSSEPTVLICNGRVLRAEMKKVRVSLDELLCELRQNNVSDIVRIAGYQHITEKPSGAPVKSLFIAEIIYTRPGDNRPAVVHLPVQRTHADTAVAAKMLHIAADALSLNELRGIGHSAHSSRNVAHLSYIEHQLFVAEGTLLMRLHDV